MNRIFFTFTSYLGALGLLWWLVLSRQVPLYFLLPADRRDTTASWVWPVVAGLPFAVLSIYAFLIQPLEPLKPRQVCERFNAATTVSSAAWYTTLNMAPAIKALHAAKGTDTTIAFELTDEVASGPNGTPGYMVGFRTVSTEEGRPSSIEGVYYLLDFGGVWKIEDLYYTSVNQQPLEKWLRISVDYGGILQQPTVATDQPAKPARYEDRQLQVVANQAGRGLAKNLIQWEKSGGAGSSMSTVKKFFIGVGAVLGAGFAAVFGAAVKGKTEATGKGREEPADDKGSEAERDDTQPTGPAGG